MLFDIDRERLGASGRFDDAERDGIFCTVSHQPELLHLIACDLDIRKSRQQLMDAANTVLDDNTITSHIKRIRRKFAETDADFDAIETVYGMGYRWRPGH